MYTDKAIKSIRFVRNTETIYTQVRIMRAYKDHFTYVLYTPSHSSMLRLDRLVNKDSDYRKANICRVEPFIYTTEIHIEYRFLIGADPKLFQDEGF